MVISMENLLERNETQLSHKINLDQSGMVVAWAVPLFGPNL